VDRDDADECTEDAWNKNLLAGTLTEEMKKTKKIRVKMQSLLVKMINRLIREEVLPVEAVTVVTSQTFISIRCLVAPSAVPVIMLRCERIGVGNVTGTVWACPLETSLVPPPSGKKEIDLVSLGGDQAQLQYPSVLSSKDGGLSDKAESVGKKTVSTVVEDEMECEEVSSSDDNEEKDEFSESVPPSVVSIPFLSPERKKKLMEAIIKARREWKNTSSRVRVLQVVEEVNAGASFTFDYALFVVCAAWIAAMGMGTNSGPTVIASMLVSPIMGPVMGLTFGTVVRSKALVIKGVGNELVSLLMCFIVGAFWCIIMVLSGTPENRNWPSKEMLSRGDVHGLVSGVFVAIPSGIATALSTLGKNSSGMVGVAISLSLLPPAVNAAMCWTYELMLLSPNYNRNEGDTTNYWQCGGISFALTLINIVCIWLSGIFAFKLKEVAPLKEKNAFWKTDLKEYREHKDKDADINVINDGIAAAIELRNSVAIHDDLYKGVTADFDISDQRAAEQRRRGLADNALEDALFMDNKVLAQENIVPGGAINLDEAQLQDAADDTALKEDLLNNANKFGCLEDAGRALFDNDLLSSKDELLPDGSFPRTDVGVRHGAVAEEVLLNGISSDQPTKSPTHRRVRSAFS
jgi:uncharacterized hydrophobic protein (TIGR00271 family)